MSSTDLACKKLRDARMLFTFAKQQADFGDDPKYVALIIKSAMNAGGDDYMGIAESCGWTREALAKYELEKCWAAAS
jgi:hypothetical protein